MERYDNIDPNLISYFEFQNMCIYLRCLSASNMHYLVPNGNLQNGLGLLETNDDVMYMSEFHLEWKVFFIVIYVEIGMLSLNMIDGSTIIQGDEFNIQET